MSALLPTRTAPSLVAARLAAVRDGDREAGMTTAEYAVGTVAACGFSGVLYKLLTSPEVLGFLKDLIGTALKTVL